jgi:hypothetical protein
MPCDWVAIHQYYYIYGANRGNPRLVALLSLTSNNKTNREQEGFIVTKEPADAALTRREQEDGW